MPIPFCQLRTRKISPFSDKSDVRSLRCKDKRFGLCRFLANHSFKNTSFLFADQPVLVRSSHSTKVQQKSPQLTGLRTQSLNRGRDGDFW